MSIEKPTFEELKAKDYAELKARVEQALVVSAGTLGPLPTPKDAPASVSLHMDQCWALVTLADTRSVLTDGAVRTLGSDSLAVVVDTGGVTISRAAPKPAPAPPPQS